jgi:hypothetical protein
MVGTGAGGVVVVSGTALCNPRNATNATKATDGRQSTNSFVGPPLTQRLSKCSKSCAMNNVTHKFSNYPWRENRCVLIIRHPSEDQVCGSWNGDRPFGEAPTRATAQRRHEHMWPKPGRIGPDWTTDNDTTASGNPCKRLEAARAIFYARGHGVVGRGRTLYVKTGADYP